MVYNPFFQWFAKPLAAALKTVIGCSGRLVPCDQSWTPALVERLPATSVGTKGSDGPRAARIGQRGGSKCDIKQQ